MSSPALQPLLSRVPCGIASSQLPPTPVGPEATLSTISAVNARAEEKAKQVKRKIHRRRAKRISRTGIVTRSSSALDSANPEAVSTRPLNRRYRLTNARPIPPKVPASKEPSQPDQEVCAPSVSTQVGAGGEDNGGNRRGGGGRRTCGNTENTKNRKRNKRKDNGLTQAQSKCNHSWEKNFRDPARKILECFYCTKKLRHFAVCRFCAAVQCPCCEGAQAGPRRRVRCRSSCCPDGRRPQWM